MFTYHVRLKVKVNLIPVTAELPLGVDDTRIVRLIFVFPMHHIITIYNLDITKLWPFHNIINVLDWYV